MKEKLIRFVKSSKLVFVLYYAIMSLIIGFLRLFTKKNNNLILFVSAGGRYFNESPKTLYEAMLKDERFANYKLVWAFRNPEQFQEIPNSVKIDTIRYYITALKARCWITNVAIERGLKFKSRSTFYFHTTHTTLPKVMGFDAKDSKSFTGFGTSKFDCSCACSEYEAKLQESMFGIGPDNIILSGYPKNDSLTRVSDKDIESIKTKLNISADKKVILYAPTYREGYIDPVNGNIDFSKWKEILGPNYYILFRSHPSLAEKVDLSELEGFVLDVSKYPDNTDLMKISNILISDYSGIFFEYAVLKRPMFCFAYDYEEYVSNRPLYFDIRKELPGGLLKEKDLLMLIKNNPPEVENKVKSFREKYVTKYGQATELCLNKIISEIA